MKHIFIINKHAGTGKFSTELRRVLEEENIEYYVFNTRNKGKEKEIVERIAQYFKGEKVRIYSCGGSGTFRNILNSISDLSNVELAYYACGLTNDFLKIFDENQKYFHDIRNLIHGDVRKIDYIESNHGRALNTFSLGMDLAVVEGMERYRPYGILKEIVPYIMAIFYAVLRIKNVSYQIKLNDDEFGANLFEACFSNGYMLGGNLQVGIDKCANNGKANIWLQPKRSMIGAIAILIATMRGKPEKSERWGGRVEKGHTSFGVRRSDGKAFSMNLDGELVGPFDEWNARIVPKGINFVVPKQVTKGFVEEMVVDAS